MLLREITAFLKTNTMSESTFGRRAIRDPNFISGLRHGRTPRPDTVAKIRAFIQTYGDSNAA